MKPISEIVICVTCGKEYVRKINGAGRKKLAMRPSNTVNCSKECCRIYRDTNYRRKNKDFK